MKVIVPANDRVLVADSPRTTTIDGIELPENVKQQEMVYGTVISVGPLMVQDTKPKDLVCYGPFAGKTIVIEGIELRLLREGQIEGYILEVEGNGRFVESSDAGTASGN